MSILKNFDLDKLRKERARKGTTTDLVAGLNQIAPDVAKLNVGETAKIKIPEGVSTRKHVMAITAKLNNLTPKGAAWEGRRFKVLSDGIEFVYVQRGEDLAKKDIKARNRGRAGGRRKAVEAPEVQGAGTVTAPDNHNGAKQSGARVTEHA